jgi:hypothetical protein
MSSETAPPRMKSNIGTSQAIADEEIENADRETGGAGGEHDEIKHGIALGRIGKRSRRTPLQSTVLEKALHAYKSERDLLAPL